MGYRYPQPDNEDGFEQLCVRLYRKIWNNECLQLYAKRGEAQDGVDIFDPLSMSPIRAVQCKHHEESKTITPKAIKKEVAAAEKSHFRIERYVIATTAKKSSQAQKAVADLNLRPNKKFTVEIHFWEEICQYISECGAITAEAIVYGQNFLAGTGLSNQSTPPQYVPTALGQEQDIDEPYATIERLLDQRQVNLARHELDKLPDDTKGLPSTHRYKVLRLRAKLQWELGEFEAAGQLFLEAYSTLPDLDQAKQNRVLAFTLLGNFEKAYEIAIDYVSQDLKTPVLMLRLIDSITKPEQLQENLPLFASFLDTDEGVNVALTHKHVRFGEYGNALTTAHNAIRISPASPHAHLAAAMAEHSSAVHGDIRSRRQRLQTALSHYNLAESGAREQKYLSLLPELLIHRAAIHKLMGDDSAAEIDYRLAVNTAQNPSIYASRAVGFFLQGDNFNAAKEFLGFLDRASIEGRYLTLVIECHDSSPEQKRIHIDAMKALSEEDWEKAIECRFHCVQWALDLQQPALAESCVPLVFQQNHAFQAHAMLAWIRFASKDQEQSRKEVEQALKAGIQQAHPQELRLLAHLLVKLKDDANALALFEPLTVPGVLDDNMKMLIKCAQRLERHDLLLRLCRELRESGCDDEQLFKCEMQLLSRYVPNEAIDLADELVRRSSTPGYFVAFKNMLAVRLKRLDLVKLNPALLPSPAQVPLPDVQIVLSPYEATGKYDEGVSFLYRQLRLHFEDELAHSNYCFFFLKHGEKSTLCRAPEVLESGCAILLEINPDERRWVTIEDDHPAASRSEFATDNRLSQAVIGHKIGDLVEIPTPFFQPQQAVVREIQTKYVRAFQDSIQHFQLRFPETSVLQQVHVGAGDNFDPSAIIESLKGRQEHVEHCLQIYCSQPCSLYLLADRLGITELDAAKSLIQQPDRLVQCCQTTPQSFEQAVLAGIQTGSIVLSISAIITLMQIDGWRFLDPTKRYVISQLTSELIDAWVHESTTGLTVGTIGLDADQHIVVHETTAEQRQQRCDELLALRKTIDERCEIVSSVIVAELAPERRKLYNSVVGLHNVEAAGVAKSQNAVLWSDDVVVSFVGTTDFGVSNVWTQLAFRSFVAAGVLSLEQFEVFSSKLASWNYSNTIWTPETIIAAGMTSDWNVNSWPLKQCIGLIGRSNLPIAAQTGTVIGFLLALRRSDCIELKQGAVIQATLNAFDNAIATRWILGHLDRVFGIDIFSADFVRDELVYWLRLR